MNILYLIIFFILGLLFGSFFTVVGYRVPKHENFISNRSYCDKCKHTLSLLDMVPILSYLFLHGRCRYCKSKIDNLSTYMELFCGILFALAYFVFGISFELLIALGIIGLLIILSVSDISYFVIPDEILIFFSGYFIIINCLNKGVMYSLYTILSGICLFLVMYGILLLGNFVFKKESLGGGDVKLMFVIGLVINPILGLIVIFIGSLVALPVSLILLYKKRQNLIPFGPFLLISFTLVYFTGININMILEFLKTI